MPLSAPCDIAGKVGRRHRRKTNARGVYAPPLMPSDIPGNGPPLMPPDFPGTVSHDPKPLRELQHKPRADRMVTRIGGRSMATNPKLSKAEIEAEIEAIAEEIEDVDDRIDELTNEKDDLLSEIEDLQEQLDDAEDEEEEEAEAAN